MASNLKMFRESLGWSQAKLAERANTSQPQIDRLEKNIRRLTVDWLVRLSTALGCSPADLLPGSVNPNGLTEEASAYEAPAHGDRLLAALAPGRTDCFWLHVRSDALNLRGILPHDYLICEPASKPRPGDILIVNFADEQGAGHTYLREMADGFLKPVSSNTTHEALPYNEEDPNIAILGRMVFRLGGKGMIAA